jgi:hypothetical protein
MRTVATAVPKAHTDVNDTANAVRPERGVEHGRHVTPEPRLRQSVDGVGDVEQSIEQRQVTQPERDAPQLFSLSPATDQRLVTNGQQYRDQVADAQPRKHRHRDLGHGHSEPSGRLHDQG